MRRDVVVAALLGGGLILSAVSWASWSDGPKVEPTLESSPSVSSSTADRTITQRHPTIRPHIRVANRVLFAPDRAQELLLPTLGVAARVTPIAVEESRTLVPPSDYTTVGWWSGGAAPGAPQGTTILTGHTVHTGGGALDDLEDLRPGDSVVVVRPHRDLEYAVASVRIYRKGRLAERASQVFGQDGPGRLAIVTCEDWNGEIYLSNVVVIATEPRAISRQ